MCKCTHTLTVTKVAKFREFVLDGKTDIFSGHQATWVGPAVPWPCTFLMLGTAWLSSGSQQLVYLGELDGHSGPVIFAFSLWEECGFVFSVPCSVTAGWGTLDEADGRDFINSGRHRILDMLVQPVQWNHRPGTESQPKGFAQSQHRR